MTSPACNRHKAQGVFGLSVERGFVRGAEPFAYAIVRRSSNEGQCDVITASPAAVDGPKAGPARRSRGLRCAATALVSAMAGAVAASVLQVGHAYVYSLFPSGSLERQQERLPGLQFQSYCMQNMRQEGNRRASARRARRATPTAPAATTFGCSASRANPLCRGSTMS